MQYTIRNAPKHLDRAIRERARRENKSINQVALEGLLRAFGLQGEQPVQRDLSDIVGTWREDPEMDKVFEEQRHVDPEMWR